MVRARRQGLRLATADKHKRLDNLIGSFNDLCSYRRYLSIMARFRSSVEHYFLLNEARDDQATSPLLLFDHLQADCRDLGVSPPAVCCPLELDEDQRLGAQYVLEGSAIGARILFKAAETLGLNDRYAARHLAVQARSTSRWPRFLERLETAQPFDLPAEISGADKVFDLAIEAAEAASAP